MQDREKFALQKDEALDGQSEPMRRSCRSSRAMREEMPAPITFVATSVGGAPQEVLELEEGSEDPKTVEEVVSPMSLGLPDVSRFTRAAYTPKSSGSTTGAYTLGRCKCTTTRHTPKTGIFATAAHTPTTSVYHYSSERLATGSDCFQLCSVRIAERHS